MAHFRFRSRRCRLSVFLGRRVMSGAHDWNLLNGLIVSSHSLFPAITCNLIAHFKLHRTQVKAYARSSTGRHTHAEHRKVSRPVSTFRSESIQPSEHGLEFAR